MNVSNTAPGRARRGTVTAVDRQDWPASVAEEFDARLVSEIVGTDLLARADRARIWTLRLAPGERFGVHRHRRSYLWLATSPGRARQHLANGETRIVDYEPGDHELTDIDPGAPFDHDLENIGDTGLTFVTVELDAAAIDAPAPGVVDVEIPASHADLLTAPLFAHLATVRPDGSPQSSVMWFEWDGARLRFTHTLDRQKTRNLRREPRVSVHIQDPASPYRTLEVRGLVESIDADPDATFYRRLQQRYGRTHPVYDADQRVVITVRPTKFVSIEGGLTPAEQQHLHRLLEALERPQG